VTGVETAQPFTVWSLLVDLAIFGGLLIVGQTLRSASPLLQKARIPASIVGGVLALVLGPGGLDVLPLSEQLSRYPEALVVMVFAATAVGFTATGRNPRREVGEVLSHVTFGIFAQYGWGLLISIFLLSSLWDLPAGFGFVLGIGFWGGPGTTVAAASGFDPSVRAEILSLGLTAWMVGVLTAVVVGTLVINLRGANSGSSSPGATGPQAPGSGLIPEELRRPLGMETVSPAAVESLSLQLAFVIIPTVVGWLTSLLLKDIWPSVSIPAFALALMAGFLLRGGLGITRMGSYLDRETIGRIAGVCTDFLIVAGMAVISVPLVIEYFAPLSILLAFGVALSLWQALVLGPRMFQRAPFEKSMLIFGMNTGTLAQGILLLRMIDPQGRSGALGTYGIVDLLIKPLTVGMVILGPILISGGLSAPLGVACSLLAFVPLLLVRRIGWWQAPNRIGSNVTEQRRSE